MKTLSLITLSLFLFSCGNTSEPKSETKAVAANQPVPDPHEVLLKQVKALDTITPGGNYLHYTVDSTNHVVITLGNKHLKRTYRSDQFPQPGTYVYKNEWKSFVGLRNNCGSSCWTLTLLPLSKKGSLVSYDYDLAADTRNNLLFCKKHLEGNEYYVTNVVTRKKKKITLPSVAGSGLPGAGIDSIAFVKNGIYLKWKTLAGGKSKSEVFKVNI